MKRRRRQRKWSPFGVGLLVAAVICLTIYSAFGFQAPLVLFFFHIAFGVAVTVLLTEWCNIPASNLTLNKLSAMFGIGVFGISDFLWGGKLFDSDVRALTAFAGLTAIGFLIIVLGGRNRS